MIVKLFFLKSPVCYATKKLKNEEDLKVNKKIIKNINLIEKEWLETGNVLQTYCNVLEWILIFKQDSTGKVVPFDLPYLDLYNRLKRGETLIKVIFHKADDKIKHHNDDFCAAINMIGKISNQAEEFKKNISLLKYSRKWFNRLRGALFYGTQEDTKEALAPLIMWLVRRM